MTNKSKAHFGQRLTRPQELGWSVLSNAPGLAWVTLFLLIPLLFIVALSFASRGTYGDVQWRFTLENFKRFIGFGQFGFEPLYPKIILRSLVMAFGTTTLCIAASLPLTFFIAGLPKHLKQIGLMLVVIPFWTNLLIRTYAWQILFSSTGWLGRAAASVGLIQPGDALYPSAFAVFVVLTCDFIPLLALPLYASVEKIDWAIAEAASDLGAGRWRVFWHALLPQIKPGLFAGGILTFVAATGQFVIPDLMGGAKTVLLGNVIQQQFGISRDWPFGSAISCLAMLIVIAGLWLFARSAGEEGRGTIV
jgi:spermidine/putrescine transport system permease protein